MSRAGTDAAAERAGDASAVAFDSFDLRRCFFKPVASLLVSHSESPPVVATEDESMCCLNWLCLLLDLEPPPLAIGVLSIAARASRFRDFAGLFLPGVLRFSAAASTNL
jgi:hypothetical protein